jgi:glycosyltransferase involved in cell wall biosynthesis
VFPRRYRGKSTRRGRPPDLPEFVARSRPFFNPIRWTSLGLALIEAMTVGLPVIGLATTEHVTVIRNGGSGFLDTDPAKLIGPVRDLLADPGEARRMGENSRRYAEPARQGATA